MNLIKLIIFGAVIAGVVIFLNSLGQDPPEKESTNRTSHQNSYERSDSYQDTPDDSRDEGHYGADRAIQKDAINRRLRRY